jgi:hypothetical protein
MAATAVAEGGFLQGSLKLRADGIVSSWYLFL